MSDVIPVNKRVLDFIKYGCSDDRIVLNVVPPEGQEGMSASEGLFEQFHRERTKEGWLRTKNQSNICSMEIWYENEELTFYFTVPNEEEENHYRRMLSGYFKGMSITEMIDSSEKFVTPSDGHYVSTAELSLRKHHFEPIGTSLAGDDQSADDDPYQSILNEMDTKNVKMRTVIQVVYKPALESWNRMFRTDVEEYAERLEEEGISNPRWFGVRKDRVAEKSARSAGATSARDRASDPGFITDIRIAVFSDEEKEVKDQLDTLVSLFSTNFRSRTGQQFVERRKVSSAETLAKMVKRESDRMSVPSGPKDWLNFNLRRNVDSVVLSLPEIVSVAHIPSSNDINVDGIQWSDDPVKGTLPPNAKKFKPVTDEEKEAAGPDAGTPEMHKKNKQNPKLNNQQ